MVCVNCFLSPVSFHSVSARLPFLCSLVMELSPGALASPCGAWLLSISQDQNCQRSRQRWETPWSTSTEISTPRLVVYHVCRRWYSCFEFPRLPGRSWCAAHCIYQFTALRRRGRCATGSNAVCKKKKKCLSLGLRSDQNFPHSEVFQLKLFMIRDDGGAFVSGLLWLRTLNNYISLTP